MSGRGTTTRLMDYLLTPCMSSLKSSSSYIVPGAVGSASRTLSGISSMNALRALVAFPMVKTGGLGRSDEVGKYGIIKDVVVSADVFALS